MSDASIDALVDSRAGITVSTALRLAKFFGTTPDFWINLQLHCDMCDARREEKPVLASITAWQCPADPPAASA